MFHHEIPCVGRVASRPILRALALAGLGLAAGACRSNEGHLIVVGGGLQPDNAAVYEHIVSLGGEEATIGVLPTASGVYRESGPRAAEVLDVYSAEGRAEVIDITMDNPEEAANPEKAAQIARHRILYFTGGDQSRILAAFRPEEGDTVCYQRMVEHLPEGGVIAGTSAGAAMMSDPSIRGGRSADALRRGATYVRSGDEEGEGVLVGRGMGFFPYGITGQHFLSRGRMGRMIIALEATGVARGYGVDDNNAMHVDLGRDEITALGGRGLLVVDVSEATRSGMGLSGVRVSLLGHGDKVDGETGEVEPAEGKVETTVDAGLPASHPIDPDVWGDRRVPALIEALALSPATAVEGTDGTFVVRFSEDEHTRFLIGPSGDPITLTAVGVRVDITPRDPSALPATATWLERPILPETPSS